MPWKKGDPRAVEAGRKGGKKAAGGAFGRDPDFARECGRKGGLTTAAKAKGKFPNLINPGSNNNGE